MCIDYPVSQPMNTGLAVLPCRPKRELHNPVNEIVAGTVSFAGQVL